MYSASFSNETHSVGISFEPGEDRFLVLLFTKENGKLSEIDDRVKTPRLVELNERYMPGVTREERAANEAFFKPILVDDGQERILLKYAKELRLILPGHLAPKS